MRRSQLIQIAILVVAIIMGYKFVESMISILLPLVFQFQNSLGEGLTILIRYILIAVIYGVAFALLVRYNKPLAEFIIVQGRYSKSEDEEMIAVRIRSNDLFLIVIAAVALVSLIEDVPSIIYYVFSYFKRTTDFPNYRGNEEFKMTAMRFVVAIVVILAAKPIVGWFSKHMAGRQPLIETTDDRSDKSPPPTASGDQASLPPTD